MAPSPRTAHSVPNNNDGNNEDGCSSHFKKTVCLQDWWLIKADKDFEGKRLAVAGLTSRGKQPVRKFSSAPITRRFDVFTLETADGICVMIQGLMNKLQTIENGFSSEVFSHFSFGFPTYWEEYAKNYFREESSKGISFGNISTAEKATTKPARFPRSVEEVRVSIDSIFSDGNLEGTEQPTSPVVQSKIDATPSEVNFTPPKSDGKRSVIKWNLRKKQRENPLSRCSMKDKDERYISEVAESKSPRGNSSQSAVRSQVEIEASEVSSGSEVEGLRVSIDSKFSDGNLGGTEQPTAPMVHSRIDATLNVVEMNAVNFMPANFDGKRTVVKGNLRRKLRQNPGSRCSIKDEDEKYKREVTESKRPKGNSSQAAACSEVEIEESEATPSQSARKMSRNLLGTPKSKGKKQHSSANKSKRKIIFDAHVSPLNQEREVCIVSPESLSSKRSRSGRLVVQPLHFWRNQIPIYDADRNMIGIQEDK